MAGNDDVREIDTGKPMERFARGWHCLGLADDFSDGSPHGVEAFGTKLVVFRDHRRRTSHTGRVLPPHGRRSLARLRQGGLRCLPIPRLALAGVDRTLFPGSLRQADAASGPHPQALAYQGSQRPTPGMARSRRVRPAVGAVSPEIEGYADGAWSPWAWNKLLIEGSHCREIVDNNVDMAHFFYVHRAYPTYFKNVIEGHTATQFMDSIHGPTPRRTSRSSGKEQN